MKKSIENKALEDLIESSGKKAFAFESRQSVRTTFSLTKETSGKIKSLAKDRGITVKEFFEICFDLFDLLDDFMSAGMGKGKRWEEMKLQVRKTYVISRRTLTRLNEFSEKYKLPRDIVVESLIMAYTLTMEAHRSLAKKALPIIKDFLSPSGETRKKLTEILPENDPIVQRFEYIDIMIWNLVHDVETQIKEGTPVDING